MQGSERIQAIQRLRAWAVIGVVFYHFYAAFLEPRLSFERGRFGVDLFFVISGYVVTRSFLGGMEAAGETAFRSVKRFYLQRIFRIAPLALLWIGIYLFASYCYFADSRDQLMPLPMALMIAGQILTLRFNYYFAAHLTGPINGLAYYWTLMVEEHFYIVLPWFLILLRRDGWRILACLTGVLLAVAVFEPLTLHVAYPAEYGDSLIRFGTHIRYFEPLIGVGIFFSRRWFLSRQWHGVKMRWNPAIPASFLSWVCLLWIAFYPGPGTTDTCSIACAILVFLASFDFPGIAGVPWLGLNRLLQYLGSRSYGLYLAHGQILLALKILRQYWNWAPSVWVLAVCTVGLLIPIVEIFYRGVERPLIFLGRKIVYGGTP